MLSKPSKPVTVTTAQPTKPPMVLPTMAFFGCANGALHALNSSTAMAPKGATSSWKWCGSSMCTSWEWIRPSVAMPVKEPKKLNAVCVRGGRGGPATPAPANFWKYARTGPTRFSSVAPGGAGTATSLAPGAASSAPAASASGWASAAGASWQPPFTASGGSETHTASSWTTSRGVYAWSDAPFAAESSFGVSFGTPVGVTADGLGRGPPAVWRA
mmetsp:Transcript_1595/g.4694  ORF Transcript_1595/g.4694 Transcript_1595/m.4694 type:complete len:215 (+) Transcript_1595:523-1167(+)